MNYYSIYDNIIIINNQYEKIINSDDPYISLQLFNNKFEKYILKLKSKLSKDETIITIKNKKYIRKYVSTLNINKPNCNLLYDLLSNDYYNDCDIMKLYKEGIGLCQDLYYYSLHLYIESFILKSLIKSN